jgi:integrase
MAHNLRPETSGFTEKNRAFLRQFANPRALPKLLGLARDLVDRADSSADHGRRDAELVAYAVAIGIELVLPLRMEDLAGLRWDEHIHIHGDIVLLSVRAHKNGCVVNAEATPALVRLLDLYRNRYWSTLASPGSPWVFPGEHGGRRQTGGFGSQLSRVIYRQTGIMMTPHQFRHLAAWIYLRAHEGDYETLRRLLGHTSVATIMRFYQELEKLAASQRFNEIMTRLVDERFGQ